MQFGAKSERLPEEQMRLGLKAVEQAIAKGDAEAEKRDPELRKDNAARRRASHGRFHLTGGEASDSTQFETSLDMPGHPPTHRSDRQR